MKYFENKGSFQEGLNDPCFEIESEYGSFQFIFKEIKLMKSFGNVFARSHQNEGDSFGEPSFKRNNFGKTFENTKV